mmetsp:Transcript_13752/g.20876  ORF Transcript_13752/g.20876 Transcript_13752/m.20876 type:complete len:236 (-) Transcript_13752:318-1025(-)
MLLVFGTKLVNCLSDSINSSLLSHLFGGHVGVHTSSVPVSLNDWLRVERAVHLEILTDALQDVAGHHKLITGIDSDTWSDLVFLLSRHDLTVGSRNFDSGVEACFVVGVGDVATEGVLWTDGAVVWSLWAGWHASLWPSEWGAFVEVEEGKFLFHSEPNFLVLISGEGCFSYSTTIGRKRIPSWSVRITHDEDITNTITSWAEWILENSLWLQNNFGIITRRLAGRTPIEIPFGK